jgi:hypothetical protein
MLITDMVLRFGAGCAAELASTTRYITIMRSWKAALMYPTTYMSSGSSGSVTGPALSTMASASGSMAKSLSRWIYQILRRLASGTIEIELEVPRKGAYNYSMEIKEIESWVDDEIHTLYWNFRDDLDDEGGARLNEELDYLKPILIKIINKHKTVD